MKLPSFSNLFYLLSWLSENIHIMVRSTIPIEYHKGGTEANGFVIVITAVCYQSINNVAVLMSLLPGQNDVRGNGICLGIPFFFKRARMKKTRLKSNINTK